MKRLLLCAVLVVGMAGPAAANNQDGNQLLAKCQGDTTNRGFCFGYVEGVTDALDDPVEGFRACTPAGVTAGQVQDVVIAWLKANPTQRHLAAHSLVALALSEAFPCKK